MTASHSFNQEHVCGAYSAGSAGPASLLPPPPFNQEHHHLNRNRALTPLFRLGEVGVITPFYR